MKKQLVLLLTLMLGLSTTAWAQNGTLRGRVLDENSLGMPGANVFIEALGKGTPTNVDGEYILVNIPAGEHELTVSFIGYGTQTQSVSVKDGETTVVDFQLEPGVTIGEEVLILGDRLKGQAKALNQQRMNANITNIVAADQIGRFPDANIGDAMKRIPGITMQYDQGEARFGLIRGTPSRLNSVTINGERVPSAEAENREIQLDLIPSDMIQTVEVNKAVTPDMDADAIGGSVNLVTRAAPGGMRVSGTLGSGYNTLAEKPIWIGSLVLSNRFANDKLGVVLSGSLFDHNLGSDNIEAEWAEDDDGNAFIEEFDVRKYRLQRTRRSVSLSLDYAFDPNNTVYFKALYNHRDDWESRYRLRYTDIEQTDDGTWIGEVRRQTKGGINSDRVDNRRLEDQRAMNFSLSGDHLFGEKIKLDWSVNYARASEDRPNERYIRYAAEEATLNYDISDGSKPDITTDAPASAYGFDEITEENQFTKDEDVNGCIDLEIPLSTTAKTSRLKVGFRTRNKWKERDNDFFEYAPTEATEAQFENLAIVPTNDETVGDYLAGNYESGLFVTKEFLGELDLTDRSSFEEEDVFDEYVPGNFTATENILGGYAMIEQTLGEKLLVLAGLRLESTSIEYTGNEFVIDEEGDPIPDQIRSITNSDNYLNIMPGVHLKYNFNQDAILRFAWTNTLARPNYFDLVPYREVNREDNELTLGNPELEPTTSMNFDLMGEYYFKSIGLVSGGVFYKDIQDFIYVFQQSDFVDPVTGNTFDDRFQPQNGEGATLLGFEVAFQRQLDFLPGALKGLGIYTNYTYTNSDADGIRSEDGDFRTDLGLPGAAEHTLNASLSFETKKLVVRASLNFTSDYVDEVGSEAFNDRYYDTQTFLDINASYAITPMWRIFAEANNLTDQPLRYYQGIQDRVMQEEFYGPRFKLGVKFDMFK